MTSGWRRTSSARGASCGARSAASRRSSRAIAATLKPSGPRGPGIAEPRIASAAELERTRDALLRQLGAARATAAVRARRRRRAREVRDAMVAARSGAVEVVSADETGEEGCATWEVAPRLGPLGALMSWWRLKVSGVPVGRPGGRLQANGVIP